MTHKEATSVLYQTISPVTLVEINGSNSIYKHNVENRYMVISVGEECDISPVFTTIEESRTWLQP